MSTRVPSQVNRLANHFMGIHARSKLSIEEKEVREELVKALHTAYVRGQRDGEAYIRSIAPQCGKCGEMLHSGGGIGPTHCANPDCSEYDDTSKW